MKSKILKISLILTVITGLLFICTKAITQFGNNSNKEEIELENVVDTLEFGKPTGDNPLTELEKLSRWYKPKKQIVFAGFMRLFNDNKASPKLMEEKKFLFSLDSNRNCSYEVAGVEVINNNRYSLTVDNNNKFVFLTNSYKEKQGNSPQFFDIVAFAKILKETNVEAEVTKLGEDKILAVKNIKDPTVQGYEIYYSPVDYHIKKIVLQVWQLSPLKETAINSLSNNNSIQDNTNDAGKDNNETYANGHYYHLEISYSGIDTSKSTRLAAQNKYIKVVNNKVELTEPYAEYELINQVK
jgi:hypothetical protein